MTSEDGWYRKTRGDEGGLTKGGRWRVPSPLPVLRTVTGPREGGGLHPPASARPGADEPSSVIGVVLFSGRIGYRVHSE